jgi:acyl-phosphate glycerol 3-phosphate acyltransferase
MTNHNSQLLFGGLLILAYLLGAIPWGLILARIFSGQDIRLKGSRNIGATNVMREAGALPGLLTLTGDFLKGAIPVYLALLLFGSANGSADIYLAGVALAAFLGHLYPIYLKFRDGGKGVATAAGCIADCRGYPAGGDMVNNRFCHDARRRPYNQLFYFYSSPEQSETTGGRKRTQI